MTAAVTDICATLQPYSPQMANYLWRASKYTNEDPRTAIVVMRQFVEVMANHLVAHHGIDPLSVKSLSEKIEIVRPCLDGDIVERIGQIIRHGNRATHDHKETFDLPLATRLFERVKELGGWFVAYMRRFMKRHPREKTTPSEPRVDYCLKNYEIPRSASRDLFLRLLGVELRRSPPAEKKEKSLPVRKMKGGTPTVREQKRSSVSWKVLRKEVIDRELQDIQEAAKKCGRSARNSEERQAKAARLAWNEVLRGFE